MKPLLRIEASHFVAGVEVDGRAAPILRYMKDWKQIQIERYCKKKGWKCGELEDRETWRSVPGYDGLYEVSSWGRVKSLGRWKDASGRGSLYLHKGRINKLTYSDGRAIINLTSREGKQRTRAVHHLVLLAFVGPCPKGKEACHWDGNSFNNRLDNL